MPKLLILSSNPRRDLNLDREISDLNNALQRLDLFEISLGLGVCAQELPELIAQHSPQIVHFCGHGAGAQGLVFQDDEGREQLVSTEVLSLIFKTFSQEINCAVLNACDTVPQAEAIVEHIDFAIGMRQSILDKAAHLFSVSFYQGLGSGKSIEQAFQMGCIAIQIWSETNSQSAQSASDRKLIPIGDIVTTTPSSIPEYKKPILLRKIGSDRADLSGAVEFDRSPEFVRFVSEEIDRKEYKDNVRQAYDNFGQFANLNPVNLNKSEYAQRKILLTNVKQFWIEGFLQPSLQGAEAIQIDIKARQGAIADLTEGIEALNVTVELDPSYDRLKKSSIYPEIGQGRTLLILGSPGSGKTIALLQLAQRLIDRTEKDLSLPIPVVFNLSSWARDRQSIVDWLIDELREKYQVPKLLSEPWIQKQQLILLLDGLDEVDLRYRDDCVRALNEFIVIFPQTEVAVCSRIKDYEALTERLQISSALCLQPLTAQQVYGVLDKKGNTLDGLKTLLKNDPELEQFAKTPLILNFMSMAYAGWSVKELSPQLSAISDENRRLNLFNAYIDLRLKQGASSTYPRDRILHWLSWLASRMFEKKRTIFLIEKIQPNWLQNQGEERDYHIIIFTIAGLFSGVNGAIVGWVTTLLIPQLTVLGMIWDREIIGRTPLIFGIAAALIGAIVTAIPSTISPLEQFSWSWQRAKSRWVGELFNGVCYGMILGLISLLIFRDITGLYFGLVIGHIFGLFLGLGSGLGSSAIKQHIHPNQGIRSSVRNCIVIGVIGGLLFGLIFGSIAKLFIPNQPVVGVGVIGGLIFGLIFGLKYGGAASTEHFTLRQILYRKGRIPWNYAKFLDFAADRLLIKKVGGGYVFFHRMLLEHFARMNRN